MDGFNGYSWIGLPLLVFCARVLDVSLGTLRIIFTSRGKRNIAPLLGFLEVFIWIVVVSQVVQGVHSLPAYFGYAAGFSVGTYVGMRIEDRMALGTLVLRIILASGADQLTAALRTSGFGVTSVIGQGAHGEVKLLYTVVPRKNLGEVVRIIHDTRPGTFFSVEEIRSNEQGIFPLVLR